MYKWRHGCQVEKELKDICRDVLDILDKHLIPASGTGESKVFYYKMYVRWSTAVIIYPDTGRDLNPFRACSVKMWGRHMNCVMSSSDPQIMEINK